MANRPWLRPLLRSLLMFILLALSTKRAVSSWNDAARMGTIQSLVESHTLAIDDSDFVDISSDVYRYRGRTYSSKPPLLAIAVSPVYAGLQQLGITFDRHPAWSYYLVTLLSIGVVSAAGVGLLWHLWVVVLGRNGMWADVAVASVATGTLFLPFSTVFNSHTISAVLLLVGFYFALLHSRDGKGRAAICCGLGLSLAAAVDPSLAVFLPVGLWLVGRKSRSGTLAFLLATAPIALLAIGLNLGTSGSVLPPTLNAPLRDYPGSEFREQPLSGLAGHDDVGDVLVYGFHSLLGNRGLFSHSPILLFAVAGAFALASSRTARKYRRVFIWFGAGCLLYILLFLLRTSNYSGEAFGIRWFASLMLVLCLPLGFLEGRLRQSNPLRLAFLVVGILSIALSVLGSYRPFLPVSDFVPGQPGVVDNTIVVALERFVERASLGGQLRTLALGFLSGGLFSLAFWRWNRSRPSAVAQR